MWRIIRPDAMKVLKDTKARQSLQRYFDVMERKKPAKHLITRKIPVSEHIEKANTNRLWQTHKKLLSEFRETQKKIDNGDLALTDLEDPETNLLDLKIELATRILQACHFCERKCGKNRINGERGFCNVGMEAEIASEFLHMGEEAPLVPSYTIFFCGCPFHCVYCQNYTISRQIEKGSPLTPQEIARLIDDRRKEGARNVNWVGGSPTPNLHNILKALRYVKESIPSVWNSNMYMSTESMELLDGIVDVYLTDLKYGNDTCAKRLSKVDNYWGIATRNHRLAYKQAELLIRHLVLPNHVICCTKLILTWIANNLSRNVRINIMPQYRPMFKAHEYEEINRRPATSEMSKAFEIARKVGLANLEPKRTGIL